MTVIIKQNIDLMATELEMICRKDIAFGVSCRERERRHRMQDDDDDEYDEEERGSSPSSQSWSPSPSPPPAPAPNRSGASGHRRNRW
jgi:hypothetical protein